MLYNTKNPHGGDIYEGSIRIDFSANTNPYGTPPAVTEAIIQSLEKADRYPDPYCRSLVAAIAEHEQLPQNRILCGNGAAELIYSYCQALRPTSAAELAPTFSEYSLGLDLVNCIPHRYILNAGNDFVLTEDFLDWLADRSPEVLFLCTPNNPTGQAIPHDFLDKILSVCARMQIRLFLDECFLDLSDDPQSLKDRLDAHPELLILRAFTKSYGMAGIRLGYCLSADSELLTAMSHTVQPWNISVPAQAAGRAALRETAFLQKTRELIPGQRQYLEQGLKRFGFRVITGEANYLLFQAGSDLRMKLLKEGIAIRSCANYYGLDETWYRIAVRLPDENRTLLESIARCTERI